MKCFLIFLFVIALVVMVFADDAVQVEEIPQDVPKKTTKRGIYGGYGYGFRSSYYGGYGLYGGYKGYGLYGGHYPHYYGGYYPYYSGYHGFGGYGGYGWW